MPEYDLKTLVTRPLQRELGRQLGQSRPGDTNAVSIYSPADGVVAEIIQIVVSNTTAASADYRIFHDDDGTTYDETTALYFDVALAANTTILLNVSLFMSNTAGNLAVRTDTINALTFTVYGEEIQTRAR